MTETSKQLAQVLGMELDENISNNWDKRLIKSLTLSGDAVEDFRVLRTRILYPFTGKPPRSLLVASATPQEGKSFVCANLGILLAQDLKQYSMLVDCDLRAPSIHQLFGLKNNKGLVDHLQKNVSLADLIVPTGVQKLSLLPAGPPPVNPAELLGSDTMLHLVDELVDRYEDRIVLFDSPPLQTAAETAILARHVDGVVLVVRWGESRRDQVKELVELIGRENIVGVVFNGRKVNRLESMIFG